VAFGDDAHEPIAERAIDEEWITLADLHASLDDVPSVELPRPQAEIGLSPPRSDDDVAALDRAAPSSPSERGDVSPRSAPARPARERRASAHLGVAIFAGALMGSAAVAMFMVLARRDDPRPAALALPSVPAVTVDPLAVAAPAPVVMDLEPALAPTGSEGAIATLSIRARQSRSPLIRFARAAARLGASGPQAASPVVTPKTPISKTRPALMYAQRGEIAQAIRRLENCEPPERELVRQRIGQRGASDVRAKAEKGQCDEAAAIVAQVESIEAAAAAKVAFASLCNSRAREVENESAGP
jgi:hypothetical protein